MVVRTDASLAVSYIAVFLFAANQYAVLPISVEYVLWLNAPIPVAPLLLALTAVGSVGSGMLQSWLSAFAYRNPFIVSILLLITANVCSALAEGYNSISLLVFSRLLLGLGAVRVLSRRYAADIAAHAASQLHPITPDSTRSAVSSVAASANPIRGDNSAGSFSVGVSYLLASAAGTGFGPGLAGLCWHASKWLERFGVAIGMNIDGVSYTGLDRFTAVSWVMALVWCAFGAVFVSVFEEPTEILLIREEYRQRHFWQAAAAHAAQAAAAAAAKNTANAAVLSKSGVPVPVGYDTSDEEYDHTPTETDQLTSAANADAEADAEPEAEADAAAGEQKYPTVKSVLVRVQKALDSTAPANAAAESDSATKQTLLARRQSAAAKPATDAAPPAAGAVAASGKAQTAPVSIAKNKRSLSTATAPRRKSGVQSVPHTPGTRTRRYASDFRPDDWGSHSASARSRSNSGSFSHSPALVGAASTTAGGASAVPTLDSVDASELSAAASSTATTNSSSSQLTRMPSGGAFANRLSHHQPPATQRATAAPAVSRMPKRHVTRSEPNLSGLLTPNTPNSQFTVLAMLRSRGASPVVGSSPSPSVPTSAGSTLTPTQMSGLKFHLSTALPITPASASASGATVMTGAGAVGGSGGAIAVSMTSSGSVAATTGVGAGAGDAPVSSIAPIAETDSRWNQHRGSLHRLRTNDSPPNTTTNAATNTPATAAASSARPHSAGAATNFGGSPTFSSALAIPAHLQQHANGDSGSGSALTLQLPISGGRRHSHHSALFGSPPQSASPNHAFRSIRTGAHAIQAPHSQPHSTSHRAQAAAASADGVTSPLPSDASGSILSILAEHNAHHQSVVSPTKSHSGHTPVPIHSHRSNSPPSPPTATGAAPPTDGAGEPLLRISVARDINSRSPLPVVPVGSGARPPSGGVSGHGMVASASSVSLSISPTSGAQSRSHSTLHSRSGSTTALNAHHPQWPQPPSAAGVFRVSSIESAGNSSTDSDFQSHDIPPTAASQSQAIRTAAASAAAAAAVHNQSLNSSGDVDEAEDEPESPAAADQLIFIPPPLPPPRGGGRGRAASDRPDVTYADARARTASQTSSQLAAARALAHLNGLKPSSGGGGSGGESLSVDSEAFARSERFRIYRLRSLCVVLFIYCLLCVATEAVLVSAPIVTAFYLDWSPVIGGLLLAVFGLCGVPLTAVVANLLIVHFRLRDSATNSPAAGALTSAAATTHRAPIPMQPVSATGAAAGTAASANERTALLGSSHQTISFSVSPSRATGNRSDSVTAAAAGGVSTTNSSPFEERNLLILCILSGAAGLSLLAVWPQLQSRTGALYLIGSGICAFSARTLDVVVMSLSVALPPPFMHHTRYSASFLTVQAATIGQAIGSLIVCVVSAGWGLAPIQSTIAFPLLGSCVIALAAALWFYPALTTKVSLSAVSPSVSAYADANELQPLASSNSAVVRT